MPLLSVRPTTTMIFVTSLLVSLVVMTQSADQNIYDTTVPPLPDPLTIFDVISDASTADVKASLTGITVYHSFKVVGEKRYVFVTSCNDTQAMAEIEFPAGSAVTQVPAVHRSDFNNMFGVEHGWEEEYVFEESLQHRILVFTSWEIHFPAGTTVGEYNSRMAEAARRMAALHNAVKPMSYAALATYPTKLFYFADVEDNVAQYVVRDDMAALGGPGNVRMTFKRVIVI